MSSASGIDQPGPGHRPDPDRAEQRRMLVLLALLPLVTIVAMALGIAFGVRGDRATMYSLALGTLALAFVPLILDQGRRPSQRHILLALMALVYTAHYTIPAFTIYLTGFYESTASLVETMQLTMPQLITGQWAALLGLVALLAGYALPHGRLIAQAFPKPRWDWSLGVTLKVAFFMLVAGWGMMAMSVVGSIASIIGTGIAATIASALVYGNVLVTAAWLRFRSKAALLLLPVSVIPTVVLGLFTGSKEAILIAPFMVGLTIVVDRRRLPVRWIAAGIIAIALVYPFSMFYRTVILRDMTLDAVDILKNPVSAIQRTTSFLASSKPSDYFVEGLQATGARLDGLGISSVIIRDTPSVSPYQNGRTLGLFFVAFVPRAFWPDKPLITIGQWVTDVYGSGPQVRSSTAATQVGEFYMNFGYAGVIAGMLLLGTILRITHETLLRGRPTMPALLAVVVILYHLVVRFETNFAGLYSGTIFALIPLVAMQFLMRSSRNVRRILPEAGAWAEAPNETSRTT